MTSYIGKKLSNYISLRNKLIDRLGCGDLDKVGFLFENYMLITRFNIKPFISPDTIDKCLYNYQYFNTLAKYNKTYPDKRLARKNIDMVKFFYDKKDQTIKAIISHKDAGIINAYPIRLHSKRLNKELMEIVLEDQEKCILHSLDPEIKKTLIKMKVYDDKPRESIISDYVNKPY